MANAWVKARQRHGKHVQLHDNDRAHAWQHLATSGHTQGTHTLQHMANQRNCMANAGQTPGQAHYDMGKLPPIRVGRFEHSHQVEWADSNAKPPTPSGRTEALSALSRRHGRTPFLSMAASSSG